MNSELILKDFLGIYNVVKWIFIILDILLLFIFIFSFYKAWQFRPKFYYSKKKKAFTLRKEIYRAKWFEIIVRLESNDENQYKMALIEADKLVNDILKEIGVKGKHLPDKLSRIQPESLESLNDLLEAHRIRNNVLYTPGFSLTKEETQKTLNLYEKFLKEIGVIIE